MKAVKVAGAVLGAIIVIAVLALVVGIPSGFLTSTIQSRVARATGYRLDIAGTTRIGLWPTFNIALTGVTLNDPRDHDGTRRLTIGSLTADTTLASVWSDHPEINELKIDKPVLSLPLLRERLREAAAVAQMPAPQDETGAIAIRHVSVTDGTVVMSNPHDRGEGRIEAIDADAAIGTDGLIKLTGNARAGDTALKFDIKATAPSLPLERQNIPLELSLEMPGVLRTPLTARAEARLNGQVVMINGVSGTLDGGAFNGWASVDVASKPLVKLDLDFQRLDLGGAGRAPQQASQPWSDAPFSLTGLNYVDVQARISAAEVNLGDSQFGPAASEATLAGGILKLSVPNLGAYGGQASGEMTIDATAPNPSYVMHCDLANVRALPLLSNLAGFDKLDGKLQAKIGARASGTSPRAIMAGLSGTAFANFQDGAIRGLNVARMIRALTSGTLSGWQETQDQSTDLTQLAASFRIANGQATTSDLNLVGPLVRVTGGGMVDIGAKQLALKVEPKLVMTTEGQGRATDPVGLGIPVAIDGPWDNPRIYPDMAGILDNPDAAYAKLKEMGKGLFGSSGGGLDGLINGLSGLAGPQGNSGAGTGDAGSGGSSRPPGGSLGEAIGNLIQQGLQGAPNSNRRRNLQGTPQSDQAAPQAQPDSRQDSQPMNDVLKQLFGR